MLSQWYKVLQMCIEGMSIYPQQYSFVLAWLNYEQINTIYSDVIKKKRKEKGVAGEKARGKVGENFKDFVLVLAI